MQPLLTYGYQGKLVPMFFGASVGFIVCSPVIPIYDFFVCVCVCVCVFFFNFIL
jgi:hypothetical protein